jgi:hypothetical protein
MATPGICDLLNLQGSSAQIFTQLVPTSTPNIARVSTSSKTDKHSEAPLLRAELRHNVVDGMDFELFVRETLKLSDSRYQTIKQAVQSGTFGPAADWDRLIGAVSEIPLGSEAQLYSPLLRLYNWVRDRLSLLPEFETRTGLWFKDTSNTPLLDSPASRKPDITGLSAPVFQGTPSWKDVLVCWEIKHKKRRPEGRLEKPPQEKVRSSTLGLHSLIHRSV